MVTSLFDQTTIRFLIQWDVMANISMNSMHNLTIC